MEKKWEVRKTSFSCCAIITGSSISIYLGLALDFGLLDISDLLPLSVSARFFDYNLGKPTLQPKERREKEGRQENTGRKEGRDREEGRKTGKQEGRKEDGKEGREGEGEGRKEARREGK